MWHIHIRVDVYYLTIGSEKKENITGCAAIVKSLKTSTPIHSAEVDLLHKVAVIYITNIDKVEMVLSGSFRVFLIHAGLRCILENIIRNAKIIIMRP